MKRQVANVRAHYREAGLAEVVAVCALLGILNRWNSTLATDLEPELALLAVEHLSEPVGGRERTTYPTGR